MIADEQERRIRSSPLLVKDPEVNAYVKRVLCDTVGNDRCGAVRIYVLEIPAFNATMRPNGAMTVWTGLLLRTRNEAELAAVLGHEFAHFELRHGVEGFQNRRGATDSMAWVQVLGAISGTDVSASLNSIVGSIFKYDREQEKEADLLGQKYLEVSKYPSEAAATLWSHIMAEADATDEGKKIKPTKKYSAGFFDTHPASAERAAYLAAQAARTPDPGDANALGHRSALAPIMPSLLRARVKRYDFNGTDYLLTELSKVEGWTGPLLFARAELYRERGNPRDFVTAVKFYDEAIALGFAKPEVFRGLGMALLKSGDTEQGKQRLSQYLQLSPDAGDAKMIQMLVAE
jgi:predicted Zn-dependent protease